MASVNKDDYFQAALSLLAKEGFGTLRLTTLCRSVGMSTGSFYNWFRDWNDFVDQFLAYWETELTERLLSKVATTLDPAQRLDQLRELAQIVPHDAEVALRAWSNADDRAARVRDEVDSMRRKIIFDTILSLVADPKLAERLSSLGLSIVVGHQHLDVGTMDWSLSQFNALVRLHADIR
ncbi:TetR/AcrR family transcriptional regulator [Mycolicibacterium sp. P9-22]|uniref:TetR/AcrR family transcriptional regulator n=1 Tax=Mycolicibacterium sp. P9-22 TaxID=2024613 RepID=UPI0011EF646B|nr:TetR/AcrR family transcriptional regulator [Mycolicibacterium sp. P9-22]KAA0120524.1 TetR/AcrR family transcriptional regulator [Mycolicibacterium sp. P9-22]